MLYDSLYVSRYEHSLFSVCFRLIMSRPLRMHAQHRPRVTQVTKQWRRAWTWWCLPWATCWCSRPWSRRPASRLLPLPFNAVKRNWLELEASLSCKCIRCSLSYVGYSSVNWYIAPLNASESFYPEPFRTAALTTLKITSIKCPQAKPKVDEAEIYNRKFLIC